MNMVGHEDVGVQAEAVLLPEFLQSFQKLLAQCWVAEQFQSPVSSSSNKVKVR